MTDLPHPMFRDFYRAAAAPQDMMRQLQAPDECADRLDVDLDALDLCREDVLSALLAGTGANERLGAVRRPAPSASLARRDVLNARSLSDAAMPAEREGKPAGAISASSLQQTHDRFEPAARSFGRSVGPEATEPRKGSLARPGLPAVSRTGRATPAMPGTANAAERKLHFSEARRAGDRAKARQRLDTLAEPALIGAAVSTPLPMTGRQAEEIARGDGGMAPTAQTPADPGDPVAARLALVLSHLSGAAARRRPERRLDRDSMPERESSPALPESQRAAREPAQPVSAGDMALPMPSIDAAAGPPARGLRGLAQLAASFPNPSVPSTAPAVGTPTSVEPAMQPMPTPPARSEDLGRRLADILQREARRYGIEPEDGA